MTEKHGGGGFVETAGLKVGEEAKLGEETGLGKAGNALPDVGKEEGLPRAVGLNEGVEIEVGEKGSGVVTEGDPDGGGLAKNVGAVRRSRSCWRRVSRNMQIRNTRRSATSSRETCWQWRSGNCKGQLLDRRVNIGLSYYC